MWGTAQSSHAMTITSDFPNSLRILQRVPGNGVVIIAAGHFAVPNMTIYSPIWSILAEKTLQFQPTTFSRCVHQARNLVLSSGILIREL